MRIRWRLLLPLAGLVVFGGLTKGAFFIDRVTPHNPHRYFWWFSIRLDWDPLNKQPHALVPSKDSQENSLGSDLKGMWIEPGLLPEWFMVSALPAFVLGIVTVHGLGRLGVNEVWSFLISMPILIFTWFYFVGRLLDRWVKKRQRHSW